MDEYAARELDYGISQAVSALIEAMGMVAENKHRLQHGNSQAYGEEAFFALIEKYSLHHNAVLSRWRR